MPDEKRMIDKFEIIHSLRIGAREVVVGVSPEQEFMCCFCTEDGVREYYTEAMASHDYLEIMELYTDRLKGQVAAAQVQRKTLCQRRCDFVVFRRKENVKKRRGKVYSL